MTSSSYTIRSPLRCRCFTAGEMPAGSGVVTSTPPSRTPIPGRSYGLSLVNLTPQCSRCPSSFHPTCQSSVSRSSPRRSTRSAPRTSISTSILHSRSLTGSAWSFRGGLSHRSHALTRGRTRWACIAAYRLVREEIPDLQLALVGSMALDDPESWRCTGQVSEHAAEDPRIHLYTNLTGVGNVEVNAFQRLSEVVVQKSIREGFGLVVSESLWKGTPVVAGRAGGIPIQMPEGVGGLLVDSVEECAAAMLRLLRDRVLARAVRPKRTRPCTGALPATTTADGGAQAFIHARSPSPNPPATAAPNRSGLSPPGGLARSGQHGRGRGSR